MMGVQGLYNDGWMLSAIPKRAPWQLLGDAIDGSRQRVSRSSSSTSARTGRRTTTSPPPIRQGAGDEGPMFGRVREISGAAARCLGGDADGDAAAVAVGAAGPSSSSRASRSPAAARQRARRSQHLLYDHRGDRGAAGRRRRDDRHPWRPLRRLRAVPAEGQAGVLVEPAGPEAGAVGRSGGARARQAHARVRLQV